MLQVAELAPSQSEQRTIRARGIVVDAAFDEPGTRPHVAPAARRQSPELPPASAGCRRNAGASEAGPNQDITEALREIAPHCPLARSFYARGRPRRRRAKARRLRLANENLQFERRADAMVAGLMPGRRGRRIWIVVILTGCLPQFQSPDCRQRDLLRNKLIVSKYRLERVEFALRLGIVNCIDVQPCEWAMPRAVLCSPASGGTRM